MIVSSAQLGQPVFLLDRIARLPHVAKLYSQKKRSMLQRTAVRWMLNREQNVTEVQHPSWRRFETESGFNFWGCSVTGALTIEPPPPLHAARGGFFCDEPVLLSPSS